MPPELPSPGGILTTVRKEAERSAVRARNGVKWFAGSEFAPPHPTPSDEVWRDGKAHVRHYRRDSPPRFRTPVLAYLGLVGRSYIFDLYKGGSIVEMLMDWGFDVYVLDWGVPEAEDSQNTLETYLQGFLPQALDAVREEADSDDVNVFGYCMGAILTVHALAGQPDLPVRSFVSLAAPYDFHQLGPFVDALRDGKLDPEDALDSNGNLPGALVRESFKRRKPTSDIVNYANLWQNLWNDQYVEGYQAIGRFLSDHIPVAGATFRQQRQQWIVDNGFVTDRLRFAGRRVSLKDVELPVLGVIAELDDIAPVESANVLPDVLPNCDVELLQIQAGHVSLFAGRKAVKEVMPAIFEWIESKSEEVA